MLGCDLNSERNKIREKSKRHLSPWFFLFHIGFFPFFWGGGLYLELYAVNFHSKLVDCRVALIAFC
jgi:hypothetical protein